MKKKTRVLIFLFLLTVFLIGSPLLILYTAGYKLNLKKGRLDKTGSIIIETKPDNAEIYLNGIKQNEKTDSRINRLLPNNYTIKLKKPGYFTWEKTLPVKSQKTTFAQNIHLFKKPELQKIIDHEIDQIFFSPNNEKALFVVNDFEQGYLYLLDMIDGKIRLIYNQNKQILAPKIDWSAKSSFIVFSEGQKRIFFNLLRQNNFFPFSELKLPKNLKNFTWDKNDPHLAYFMSDRTLYQFNFLKKSSKKIQEMKNYNISDFIVNKDFLYYIYEQNKQKFLTKKDLENPSINYKLLELKQKKYKLIDFIDNKIFLKQLDQEKLFIINTELDKILFYKKNIKNIDYHKENNLVLIQTPQELSFINLNDSSLTDYNITRYSQGLISAKWHTNPNYCLTLQDKGLHIIEMDNRDGHFIIDMNIKEVSSFEISSGTEKVYLIAEDYLLFTDLH